MSLILCEINNSIARITLNRPDKYNAFNREMAFALQEILDECDKNISIRCVTITGSGKAFSAGQDIGEIMDTAHSELEKIVAEHYNPIIQKIRNLNKPVMAIVNGIAAGAGANLALCCDIVIATESASFIQAFSKIGLMPDCGGTYFLPRLIGLQKASAIMMLGDKIEATEAEKMGMIYKCYKEDAFLKEADMLATHLAQLPTKALAFTKQALNLSMHQDFEQQLQSEVEFQKKSGNTNDFKEGIAAFMEKRKPNFKGD